MAEERIGSSISEKIVEQIEARKKIVGKRDGRTNDELLYLNGRSAWIRLSSGVNTLTDEEAEQLRRQESRLDIKGSSILAGYNILQGGVLNPNRTIRQGIDLSPSTAEDTIADKAAYRNRVDTTGIRPMPGITGMTIASKNTFGTLREAEVKISVWTLQDFEMIERIYLRPGFTMLLEWGHTIYVNNQGAIQKIPPTVGTGFFANGITSGRVAEFITEHRNNTDNNYDGIVGYVKNFSWSYTPAGCYECTVTIISKGEILDSLKMAINPLKRGVLATDFAAGGTDRGKRQRKSAFHFFFDKLEIITNVKFTKDNVAAVYAASFTAKIEDFTGYYQLVESEDHPDARYFDKKIPHHYLPLRVYLDIFNKFATLVDNTKKGTKEYPIVKFNIDYTKSSKFLTIPEHFSIDPSVCALAHKHKLPQGVSDWEFGGIECIYNNLEDPQNGYDDILNILIPACHFEGILNSALDDKGQFTKGATEIFLDLLGQINTALGGINDLDLYYDEELDGGTYFIIDRNNIVNTTPPTFTLTGIDSVFTDIGVSSKISNEIGSNIAIAAQGASQTYSTNVDNLLDWNPKVIDRLIVTKDEDEDNRDNRKNTAELEKDEDKKRREWYGDVINFFSEFNGTGYEDTDVSSAKTLFNDYINYWLQYNKRIKGESSTLPVPVELTVQLDGIGGLKIGQVFRIKSGILPQNYDRFAYIITGLDHSVENNRWLTNIKTQFYDIQKYQAQPDTSRTGNEVDFANQSSANKNTPPRSKTVGGTSRTIDGVTYKNGQIPDSKLRYINNWKSYKGHIQSDGGKVRFYDTASRALDRLLADATAAGIEFKINGAYRTYDDQVKVKDQKIAQGKGDEAATPGTSPHGFGLAVDLANTSKKALTPSMKEYQWMKKNADKYGFRRLPWRNKGEAWEAWHWEYQT